MIKIGIIARKSYDDEKVASFLIREPNLRNAVLRAGGNPLLLLPQQDIKYHDDFRQNPSDCFENEKDKSLEMLKLCDGLILPGGDTWTDLDELAIDYAIEEKIPILGICLGMQVMGINKNRDNLKTLPENHHQSKDIYVHNIKIKKDTLLYKILEKEKIKVNSRHIHTIPQTSNWVISLYLKMVLSKQLKEKIIPFAWEYSGILKI